ncbi:MAG: hypothetical protein HYU99_07085 [Deltaproteobacteria bacterium]|nr:hypothetical protein [Deltaproteobacteria bacterium]
MKALTVRIPDNLDEQFTEFCRKRGYKKGGFILSLLERILAQYAGKSLIQSQQTPVYRPAADRDPLAGIEKLLGKDF